jgi:hypothetical protein
MLPSLWLLVAVGLTAATSTASFATGGTPEPEVGWDRSLTTTASAAADQGMRLTLGIQAQSIFLDRALPGHPRATGQTLAGMVTTVAANFRPLPFLRFDAGVVGRVPYSLDFEDEAGAFPVLAIQLEAFNGMCSLRVGSLDTHHGFHPALVDEARFAYGRNIEATYNRSLVEDAQRDLGSALKMPVENGAQIRFDGFDLHAEAFLDWQLLETETHREKFVVGALARYTHPWFELSSQFRLLHYGGEQFTGSDPIRSGGLDPVRQPFSVALTAALKAEVTPWLRLQAPFAFIEGRVVQTPGGDEEAHRGFEPGIDAHLFQMVHLGYRLWLPEGNQARLVSEDGEPVYEGFRSQRTRIGFSWEHPLVRLLLQLDVVFPSAGDVQTLGTFTVAFAYDPLLYGEPQ